MGIETKKDRLLNFSRLVRGTQRDEQHKQTEKTNWGGKEWVAQTGMMGRGREDKLHSLL